MASSKDRIKSKSHHQSAWRTKLWSSAAIKTCTIGLETAVICAHWYRWGWISKRARRKREKAVRGAVQPNRNVADYYLKRDFKKPRRSRFMLYMNMVLTDVAVYVNEREGESRRNKRRGRRESQREKEMRERERHQWWWRKWQQERKWIRERKKQKKKNSRGWQSR